MRTINRFTALTGLLLLAPAAGAHTFGAEGAGFAAGLLHPLIGLDHLLALIAAGLWIGWLGGGALLRLPAAFLAGLFGGTLVATGGWYLSLVEPMIGVSVLVFGILAASAARPNILIGSAVMFVFALFHGYAHATELPQAAAPIAYLLGLLLASAAVQLAAAHCAIALRRVRLARLAQTAGATVAALGGAFLIG